MSTNFFHSLIIRRRRLSGLKKVLRNTMPNVAIGIQDANSIYLALASVGLPKVATIGTEHYHPPSYPPRRIWQLLRQWCYGWLSCVVVLTEETAQWVCAHTRARRVVCIPNALPKLLDGGASSIAIPTEVGGRKIMLAVGQFTNGKIHQKGLDYLIPLFAKLSPNFPEWALVILGEGGERERVGDMIANCGMTNNIFLPGKTDAIRLWYQAASLFVLSSRFEGFPCILLEAMAQALPVVSFDCDTGPGDIIRNGEDGILVPADDLQAMEESLSMVMADSVLRARLSKRAIEVKERFAIERVTSLWETLFNEL